jgi:hypothetical protein
VNVRGTGRGISIAVPVSIQIPQLSEVIEMKKSIVALAMLIMLPIASFFFHSIGHLWILLF